MSHTPPPRRESNLEVWQMLDIALNTSTFKTRCRALSAIECTVRKWERAFNIII